MQAMKTESAAPADNEQHLLIVDDDRRIRALLSRFLMSEGYRVTTAESAAEARAKLAGLRFDLMILDVMMPGETGFEFARSLRSSSNVPILMLTARDEHQDRDRKSTRLNSSHQIISYAVFCLKKKNTSTAAPPTPLPPFTTHYCLT